VAGRGFDAFLRVAAADGTFTPDRAADFYVVTTLGAIAALESKRCLSSGSDSRLTCKGTMTY
jgi:hypothetical protein